MAAEQITQRLTPLPEAPDRKAPADFADKSDAFVAAQVGMAEEVNQMAEEINAVAEAVNEDAARADAAKGYASDALAAKEAAEIAKNAAQVSANSTASDRAAVSADRVEVQQIAGTFTDLDAALAGATSDADRAELAAAAAQSVVTQDLSAIAAEISGTAVDVFIYDTSKDSDGGAWRKRCQHTSWYNEPLNTATRGARREFPAVAVIVAEADTVTIYDGDDPALPMWMVFKSGQGAIPSIWRTERLATSVAALNGVLCVGLSGGDAGFTGLYVAEFIPDAVSRFNPLGKYGASLDVAARNDNSVQVRVVTSEAIANGTVNDVAMTVLPDAPINPATGLPVPTIAVATASGVSVINHGGTAHKSGANWGYSSVVFDGRGNLVAVRDRVNWLVLFAREDEYTAGDNFGSASYVNTAGRLVTVAGNEIIIPDHSAGGMLRYIGSPLDADTMRCAVDADHASGWMVGDCKGAFLASTDAAALSGEELVTNGDFATGDLTGWVATNANYDAGALRCADGAFSQAVFSGAKKVLVSLTQTVHAGTRSRLRLRNAADSADVGPFSYFTGSGNYSIVVDTAAGLYLRFYVESGHDVSFDNISVSPVDADRSANAGGLIVNGTLTREPVADGAELVAYSGFSADNYLEQPYNADLDFGTGDFCVMWWCYGDTNGFGTPLSCTDQSNENGFRIDNSGAFLRVMSEGAQAMFNSALSFTSGDLRHMAWVVAEGGTKASLYQNGALVHSSTQVAKPIVANTDRHLTIGTRRGGASAHFNGSIALVRISATAPTANQIRKIYEDERELFKAGAACTLYGSDSMVKALAYDDATDLLHVGTSEGRSVFKGLRRIDQTDTPVTTAIAASGGMIVEA